MLQPAGTTATSSFGFMRIVRLIRLVRLFTVMNKLQKARSAYMLVYQRRGTGVDLSSSASAARPNFFSETVDSPLELLTSCG